LKDFFKKSLTNPLFSALFSLVDESRSQQPPPSEATNLTKAKLCIPGNEQSINHCKNALSAEVTAHFHPEKKLTILTSSCVYVSNGPPGKKRRKREKKTVRKRKKKEEERKE
jgi:hypothetical protein